MNEREEFEAWYAASKYCQVVIPQSEWKQIALDGWQAALAQRTEQQAEPVARPTDTEILKVASCCTSLTQHGEQWEGEETYWVGYSLSRQHYQAATLRDVLVEIWRAEWEPEDSTARLAAQQAEPDNAKVICPNCCHQFRAIPVQVQQLMLDAGFESPFIAAPPADDEAVRLLRLARNATIANLDGVRRAIDAYLAKVG
jgi:hypothetical protein